MKIAFSWAHSVRS